MAFEPDKITKQHVLKAVQEIADKGVELRPSTGYDVIIDGIEYPPKEIMRYAHEQMNGDLIWNKTGGEPTNNYLKQLGFEIKEKEEAIGYYALGAVWNGREDQSDRFITDGIWENGYEDKFLNIVKSVQVGDRVTIKSSFATKARKSYLRIKALGTVTDNPDNGRNLIIHWDPPFEPFDLEGYGSYRNTIQKIAKSDVEVIFFRKKGASDSSSKFETVNNNIILYGPPGTGKTYHSVDYAVEIVLGKSLGNHSQNKTEFDRLRKEGQIEFVTFHQNYTYEDFMVGIRPNIEEGTESLTFKKHYGIFYEIAQRARENYLSSLVEKGKLISVQDLLNDLLETLRSGEILELKTTTNVSFTLEYLSESTIQLVYANGSKNNTLSVDTLFEVTDGKREFTTSLKSYYYPLKEHLLSKRVDTKTEKEELKNFVLVIDEINRANISKVFGELITLLEDDKRLGEANELKITLPNGEKDFGIPPNLFLIGTMNTADKSIALIDIALRRRFEFVGFYPQYEGYDENAIQLLQAINTSILEKKKSADYLIGHAYFMKNQPIDKVLESKIIPLLMEYFSGKTEIVSNIFEGSGWSVNYDPTTYYWDIFKS